MKVGFYESDITPPLGGFIPGHYQDFRGNDVIDKLYAKAVVMEDGDTTAAIIAVDTVHLPDDARDTITARIYEYTGIKPEQVSVCSNHTHTGAPVLSNPEIECYEDEAYKDVFLRLCADTVILAYKRMNEANVRFGSQDVYGIAYNRTFITNDGMYVTHGRIRNDVKEALGGIDPELGVMVFESNGRPVGAVINYALHQCCMGAIKGYSGDYSSVLAKRLKQKYGNDFVSVFIIGCCGDVNHHNPDPNVPVPADIYSRIGNTLADAAIDIISTAEPTDGKLSMITETMDIELRRMDYESAKNKLADYLNNDGHFMRVRNLLHYYDTNHDTHRNVYVQAIAVGDTCIYVLPGEIFAETGLTIKAQSPFKNNIVTENSNTSSGYIAPERVFGDKDNLYETALSYGSMFVPGADAQLACKAKEAAGKLK